MRWVIAALRLAYGAVRRSGLLETALGRRLYFWLYFTYKDRYEASALATAARHIAPGSVVFDVGANVGYTALRFAQAMDAHSALVAIEPDSANFQHLQRHLGVLAVPQVRLIQAIVTDHDGQERLLLDADLPVNHRISLSGEGVPVQAVTLDTLALEYPDKRVSLIKIDVQGAEKRVLEGAQGVLTRDKPALFVEFYEPALREFGTSSADLFDFIMSFGYTAWHIERTLSMRPIDRQSALTMLEEMAYTDFLFTAPPA
mgnify:CR=1 FL=1|jgi:FkbM family methyltransferase